MDAIYTLNNGKKVHVYIWNDLIKNEMLKQVPFHNKINTYEVSNGEIINERVVDIYVEGNHLFFNYDSEKVSIMDFDYYKTEELIKRIENNDPEINDFSILATLLKDDSFAIIDKRQIPNSVFFGLYRTYSSHDKAKYMDVLCIPIERNYKKYDWGYKIELMPVCLEDQYFYGTRTKYFSDLCTEILKNKTSKIVSRNVSDCKIKKLKK